LNLAFGGGDCIAARDTCNCDARLDDSNRKKHEEDEDDSDGCRNASP